MVAIFVNLAKCRRLDFSVKLGGWFCCKCFENGVGHIASHDVLPASGADEAFDHGGRELCDIAWGHEKNGVDLGSHVRIDVAHDAFVFVVVRRAYAAQNEVGVHALGIVDQIAVVKVGNGESLAGCGGGAEEIDALLDGKTVGFLGIIADSDDEAVEEFEATLDHPEVTVGGRIERTCVNCGAHRGDGSVFWELGQCRSGVGFLAAKKRVRRKKEGWLYTG